MLRLGDALSQQITRATRLGGSAGGRERSRPMLNRSEGKTFSKEEAAQQDAHSGRGLRVRLGAPRDRRRSRSVPSSPTLRLRRWPLLGGGVVQGEMEIGRASCRERV